MEALKKKTDCIICLQIFVEPKILPCLHTFCRECVNKLKTLARITCPTCKVTCSWREVKADFNMVQLVDIRKQHEIDDFTQRQQLDYYMKELKLIIDDYRYLDTTKIESVISQCNKMKMQALKKSAAMKRQCLQAVEARFEQIDEEIMRRCSEQLKVCEAARDKRSQNLAQIEKELQKIQTERRQTPATAKATADTSVTLAKKLANFGAVSSNCETDTIEQIYFSIERTDAWDLVKGITLNITNTAVAGAHKLEKTPLVLHNGPSTSNHIETARVSPSPVRRKKTPSRLIQFI